MGPLYDIEGFFSPDLWKGTDKLIRSVEDPGVVSTSILCSGHKVQHPVFGDGTVILTDPDTGTALIDFGAFGRRRVNPDLLSLL